MRDKPNAIYVTQPGPGSAAMAPDPTVMKNKFGGNFRFNLRPYHPGIFLFLLAVLIGLLTYKDYGISWDEVDQRANGFLNYDFMFHGNQDLFAKANDHHGMGFEMLLVIFEKWMNLTDSRDIYLMRHLVTHLFFLIGAFSGYVLLTRLFKNRFIASLGFLMLVFAPRIYAHSFFNTRDVPFLSMFLLTLTFCHRSFDKNKLWLFFVLGLFCGYTTSIRIMGVMLALLILLFLLVDLVTAVRNKEKPAKAILNIVLFSLGFCTLLVAAWPYLQKNPVGNFIESFNGLAHFSIFNGSVLINGKYENALHLPWTYFPTWFSITNPEIWLIVGFAGFAMIAMNFTRTPLQYLKNTCERNFLLHLLGFWVPILAVISLHSVIYNDWRHLYFIYPSFVFMSLYFVNCLLQKKYKLVIAGICMLQVILVGWFMIRNHPYNHLYFNNLVSHQRNYLAKNYEMDYWGCDYKQAIDHILASDKSGEIKINCKYQGSVDHQILLLPVADRNRVEFAPKENADYFITSDREDNFDDVTSGIVDSITVMSSTILYVFKEEKDTTIQKQMRGKAIADLQKVLAVHPNDSNAHSRIGNAYFGNRQFDSAEVHLKRAVELKPGNIDAINILAKSYAVEEKYPQVIELLKKAVAIDPSFLPAYANTGFYYLRLGNYDSAIGYLTKTLALDPENTSASMQLGVAYSQAQKYDLAEPYFKKAIDRNPYDISALYNLGVAYDKSGKLPEALDLFKRAVNINPNYLRGYSGMAQVYFEMKQYEAAVESINKARSVDPNDVKDIPRLALSYKALGKKDSAAKYDGIAKKLSLNSANK